MKKNSLFIFGAGIILFLTLMVFLKEPIINSSNSLKNKLFPTPTPKILTKLKIIYLPTSSAKPAIAVATKNKIFEKYGLKVEVTQVTSGNAAVQGLVGGQADIVLAGQISYLKAAAAGAKIKSIGVVNNNVRWLLVSKKSLGEIKIYCTVGKTSEIYLRGAQMMKNLGVDINTKQLVDLSSEDLCAKALVAGTVDSTVFTELNWERFKEKNKDITNYKVIEKEEGDKYLLKPTAIMVMEDTLVSKKDAIENFSKSIIEANYWLKNNSESEIAKTITGVNKISKEDALIYARLNKGFLADVKFTQELSNVEENRKQNEELTPALKKYDVKNFLSRIISDSLRKQGFLQKYGF
jgi:ABC-type nitrate/sulfonate/bicarbonate transport system substrate-binding protein